MGCSKTYDVHCNITLHTTKVLKIKISNITHPHIEMNTA